jgi:BirA family biotin operon repressor/biotin-[acetyl-CoA-carboxylase] ligase
MGTREELVYLLADGAVHSGTDLACRLNCTRTAVWKQLHRLRSMGLTVASMRGRGYQLEQALELLDRHAIARGVDAGPCLESLEVHSVIDSTSERLRALPPPAPGHLRAVLAEYQTGGRGRRGRQWLSPFGSGLCLSVSWCFSVVPPSLPALALAAGVAVNRALRPLQPSDLGLKWPNDIIAGGGKLGGLLVDVQGESGGPITVTLGVGINVDVPERLRDELSGSGGLAPVGLRALACAGPVSRNVLAANMIDQFQVMLTEFGESGFVNFIDEWRDYDYLQGEQVTVASGAQTHTGTVLGISADGALKLEADGDVRNIVSGEVTVRRSS